MYLADLPTSLLLSPIACSYVAGTPILNRLTAAGQVNYGMMLIQEKNIT